MSHAPILVDLAAASHWSGLTPGALRRRIHDGKLTRHGAKTRAMVDLRELLPKDDPRAADAMRRSAAQKASRVRRTVPA